MTDRLWHVVFCNGSMTGIPIEVTSVNVAAASEDWAREIVGQWLPTAVVAYVAEVKNDVLFNETY